MDIKKHFDNFYSNKEWKDNADEYLQRLKLAVEISPPSEMCLDIGCADGTYSRLYNAKYSGALCFGIDITTAVGVDGCHFLSGDARSLPYESKCFDFVHSSETIEHLPDYEKAIGEITRVLKKKGKLLITVPDTHPSGYRENTWEWDTNGKRLYKGTRMTEKDFEKKYRTLKRYPAFFKGHLTYLLLEKR